MKITLALTVTFSMFSLAALSGCATDVDADPGSDEPVVANVDDESTSLSPQKDSVPAPTGCTTTRSCDKDYCCTTETCQYSTFITCGSART